MAKKKQPAASAAGAADETVATPASGTAAWVDAEKSTPLAGLLRSAANAIAGAHVGGLGKPHGVSLMVTADVVGRLADNRNPADMGGEIERMRALHPERSRLGCVERVLAASGIHLCFLPDGRLPVDGGGCLDVSDVVVMSPRWDEQASADVAAAVE